MNKYKYGVTHHGQAHRDDLIACAILIGGGHVSAINRRAATPEELDDPSVVVFDVGGRHEPELGNFDHHQIRADAQPDCALWMLSRHLGYDGVLRELFPWYSVVGVLDAKGPHVFAMSVGASWDKLAGLMGPIDSFFMGEFSRQQVVDASTLPWLVAMGKDILADAAGMSEFLSRAPAEVQEVVIKGVRGFLAPTLSPMEVSRYLTIWRRLRQDALGELFGFSITRDDRGKGLTLYRYADDKRIDFCQISGEEETLFSHAGGFIAKTRTDDATKAMVLVSQSIVG